MFTVTESYVRNNLGRQTRSDMPLSCNVVISNNFDAEILEALDARDLLVCGIAKFEDIQNLCHYPFRLFDANGDILFEGSSTVPADDDKAHEPLVWGRAHFGCNSMKYLNNGEWEPWIEWVLHV
jgi:hypothetical protein